MFSDVLFRPLYIALGFITIYQSVNVKISSSLTVLTLSILRFLVPTPYTVISMTLTLRGLKFCRLSVVLMKPSKNVK